MGDQVFKNKFIIYYIQCFVLKGKFEKDIYPVMD